jgi:hypothetical protein
MLRKHVSAPQLHNENVIKNVFYNNFVLLSITFTFNVKAFIYNQKVIADVFFSKITKYFSSFEQKKCAGLSPLNFKGLFYNMIN